MRKIGIYQPRLSVSAEIDKLLKLISGQLHEYLIGQSHNAPPSEVIFSPHESLHLEASVRNVLEDKSLFHSLYFVEKLFSDISVSEEELREIYLKQRKRFGYDRSLSSARWHEYVTRLGMRKGSLSTYLRGSEMMAFAHFIRMERKLFSIYRIPSSVSEYSISLIEKNEEKIDALRKTPFNERQQKASIGFVEKFRSSLSSIRQSNSMPPEKLAALMVVITNSTSLFSSRDWSVAGTISTMAGAVTMAVYNE